MKSSEIRYLMEAHLQEFFTACPQDIPTDLDPHISPLFALGMRQGLTIQSACNYLRWLADQRKIDRIQAGGILGMIGNTAHMLGITVTPDMLGSKPYPPAFCSSDDPIHYGIVVHDETKQLRYTTIMCNHTIQSQDLPEGFYSTKIANVTCEECIHKLRRVCPY